jgi:hypothetical protein
MVNVNDIKETVEKLALKDQQGYLNPDQYNRVIVLVDKKLYQFYYKKYEDTQNVVDSLKPFLTQTVSTVQPDNSIILPLDYVHRIELGYIKSTNPNYVVYNNYTTLLCDVSQPIGTYGFDAQDGLFYQWNGQAWVRVPTLQPNIQYFPVDYMNSNEVFYTLSSPIRQPSIQNNIYRHQILNNTIYVYPKLDKVVLKYLRRTTTPVWGSTPVSTPTGDFAQYDPAISVNFEWQYENFQDLVDLVLFYLGLQVKDSEIVQFARLDQQENIIR